MNSIRSTLIPLLTGSLLFVAANGQADQIEPYTCRNGLFPTMQKSLALYRVTGPKTRRAYFYNDDEGCPYDEARCRMKSYVIPGNELLVNQVSNGWACVWYNGQYSESVGWMKVQDLALNPVRPSDMTDWTGRWRVYDWVGGIDITPNGPTFSVKGKAIWNGGTNRYGEKNIHYGDMDGFIKPEQGRAKLLHRDNNGCTADFTRIGQYLLVDDNLTCGGANVSFSGVYTRNPTAGPASYGDD